MKIPTDLKEILGLIQEIESKHDDELNADDKETLRILSAHVEIAIEGVSK